VKSFLFLKITIENSSESIKRTSPFRNSSHIELALKLWNENIDMVVSVKQTDSNPYYVLLEENINGYLNKSKEGNFIRRQDCPKVWEFNGAIYLINPESLRLMDMSKFKKVVKFEMDEKSSFDIDTLWDWSLAEFIIQSKLLVEQNG
jgi:CMP-N,N'-diacetyllegionaminic acid synthase